MLRRAVVGTLRAPRLSAVQACAAVSRTFSTVLPVSNVGIWGNDTEGDVFSINWSLTEDGVVPVGAAYRNARTALLATRLQTKVKVIIAVLVASQSTVEGVGDVDKQPLIMSSSTHNVSQR